MGERSFPWWEGLQSGWSGEDPRSCPYDWPSPEYQAWHRGQRMGVDLAVMDEAHVAAAAIRRGEPMREG